MRILSPRCAASCSQKRRTDSLIPVEKKTIFKCLGSDEKRSQDSFSFFLFISLEPDPASCQHSGPDPGGPQRRPVRGAGHRNGRLPLQPQRQVVVLRLRVPDQEQLL
jgi:hypothetical protein